MLALPEFDTYGVLPKFARNPNDRINMAGFLALKERAMRGIDWSLHPLLQYRVGVDNLLAYRLGCSHMETTAPTATGKTENSVPLSRMSEAQLKDVYMNALKTAGFNIDPTASMNNSDTQTSASDGKQQ